MQGGSGRANASSPQATGYTAISLHQPWASLLVHGIKRIEGRAWSSEHRGQLWIHSTSQRPTDEEIKVLKGAAEQYQDLNALYSGQSQSSQQLGNDKSSRKLHAMVMGCMSLLGRI